jgi:hypothetical protein
MSCTACIRVTGSFGWKVPSEYPRITPNLDKYVISFSYFHIASHHGTTHFPPLLFSQLETAKMKTAGQ